jgi:hypothetical protein
VALRIHCRRQRGSAARLSASEAAKISFAAVPTAVGGSCRWNKAMLWWSPYSSIVEPVDRRKRSRVDRRHVLLAEGIMPIFRMQLMCA